MNGWIQVRAGIGILRMLSFGHVMQIEKGTMKWAGPEPYSIYLAGIAHLQKRDIR